MELRQLEIFEAVADAGSFTAAAERLGYVQSSISMNILGLEHELGVPLFDRLGRRVELTEAGARFLPHMRQVREILEAAKTAATDMAPRGQLTVGACESPGIYRLPRLIAQMHSTYPHIDIHVNIITGDERRDALRNGRLDACMTLDDLEDPREFESVTVRQEPIHLILRTDHPLARESALEPEVIARYTHLATEPGGYRARFEAYLARYQASEARAIELGSVELIKQCVLAGLGYGVLPVMAVEQEVASGVLITRPWPHEPAFMPLRLVRYKKHWISPALRAFWDSVIDWNAPPTVVAEDPQRPADVLES